VRLSWSATGFYVVFSTNYWSWTVLLGYEPDRAAVVENQAISRKPCHKHISSHEDEMWRTQENKCIIFHMQRWRTVSLLPQYDDFVSFNSTKSRNIVAI
jgi:hypothetical protein